MDHRLKRAAVLFLCTTLILGYPGFCIPARAATVPGYFTVESIENAGITDPNFANAVYRDIAGMISADAYDVSGYTSTEEILNNYSNDNLVTGNYAEINASHKGIKSIEGIRLLKNAYIIDLTRNQIHDLTPLKKVDSSEDLYFNGTSIFIDSGNFQNVIPLELIGTVGGNITVDSTLNFEPVTMNYLRADGPQSAYLDFGLQLHGAEGGIFNQARSENVSSSTNGAVWTKYADYQNRYTGTDISGIAEDGEFRISANAQEDIPNGLVPTVRYWSGPNTDRKLNLEWNYSFKSEFYTIFKEQAQVSVKGGIVLKKTNAAGETLAGAVYELYRRETGGTETRIPDAQTVFTTDANGEVTVSGLAAGTYLFRETKAPEGYQCAIDPVQVILPDANAGAFTSAVSGGESTVLLTQPDTSYEPVWDSVYDPVRKADLHYLKISSAAPQLKAAADYEADCFLKNGGTPIDRLKGEPAAGTPYQPDAANTSITIKRGGTEYAVCQTAEEARAQINALLSGKALKAADDVISVEAAFSYINNDKTTFPVVTQVDAEEEKPEPVPVEKKDRIGAHKSWSTGVHPDFILFRLMGIFTDGSKRQIGEAKRADASNDWKAVWDITEKATLSDASGSNATMSDALLYDEDGNLLDGLVGGSTAESFYVEENPVPDGWKAVYADPAVTVQQGTETAEYEITNVKIPDTEPPVPPETPNPPETPGTPGTPERPSGGGGDHHPETPVHPVPVLPQEEVKETVVLTEIGEKLPWGRITKQRLPKTGEPGNRRMPELTAAAAWLLVLGCLLKLVRNRKSQEVRK